MDFAALLWLACRCAAARAKAGVARERMAALLARDYRLFAGWATAVGTEVRAPGQGRSALAAPGRDPVSGRGQHVVELVQSRVQAEQLVAAFGEQVLSKPVAPVHLEHQPAEVAELLFARSGEQPPLATDDTRGRERSPGRLGGGPAEAVEQGHWLTSLRPLAADQQLPLDRRSRHS